MFPIETFQTTLAKFSVILSELDIRFHLTGGLTGTAYGEPRMTQNIDVVIDPIQTQRHVNAFVIKIDESDFMFAEDAMRGAIASGDLFQLLDQTECLKLDIYPREMIPGELDRSELLEFFEGEMIPVVSRIDAAASKLVWIKKGSHKNRRDLRAIFRNCNEDQQDAVRTQARELELGELLQQVLQEPDELQ